MKSLLQVYDLAGGQIETLLELDGHYEAPNWHQNRNELLINGGGRLYRVPLDDPALHLVDTGFCKALNNDHGISPDGSAFYITDKTETGKACIYKMPLDGGVPQRLTENVPSYWHGVSPDGLTLTYAGFRDGVCQIMTAHTDGSNETVLTQGFTHCDGPDFSGCGQWIWFNGEKDGAVDLWRMRLDGSALQQMTDDSRINWFPHPSPDGRHVLYLSYPEGTKGHPANMQVRLRLMPAEGGDARDLVNLFGGRGTLNVPCWAADSRRFAFVSYVLS